jgi:hypothetical protein
MRNRSRAFSNATFVLLGVFFALWVAHHFVSHTPALFVAETILLALSFGCLIVSRWLARQKGHS